MEFIHSTLPSPSMRQTSHRRIPSPLSLKASRPALHRKSTSISKLGSGQPKRQKDDSPPSEMADSFLNFCAMCETQITTPDNSLLYCSESCRRKDSCKPLSASISSGSSVSSLTSPSSTPPTSPPIIVAPMTPTKPPTIRVQAEHDDSTDVDPTEWKPVLAKHPDTAQHSLGSSDAWHFLSQFHEESMLPHGRPIGNRSSISHSTTMSISGPLPSLIHTPPTVASSFSSNASSDYFNSLQQDSATRPLPPRHNPYFSSSVKSVDLVVPHIDPHSEDEYRDTTTKSLRPANSGVVCEDTSNVRTPTGLSGSLPSNGSPGPTWAL